MTLAPAERAGWLAALPATDAGLRDTLARLLALGDGVETDDFLRTLPKRQSGEAHAEGGPQAGDGVGPWRLVRELGEGGMGVVWLAERADGQLRRQVALKLPRPGWARGLAHRIAQERDILATLEHPNIARLYDAGVDAQGRPWLALEHVQGRPIDVHVRERGLPIRQRLELLMQVCRAVSYAHSRLVIHRDLKPSNILVTDEGQVRLLDFGIAKLIAGSQTGGAALTEAAGRVLTLDYASPEQVAGEALSTASDVYSLGVVAYELLTGARPYRLQRGSAAELEEAIASADPPRASDAASDPEARRALRGDLDAILHQALKKAVAERYPTIDALAQDLQRHLRHEPVRARPDALGYTLRKFLRRHRVQVGATAAVLGALVAGMAAAWTQAQRADAEREAAIAANAQARANQREAERQAAQAQVERAGAQAASQRAEAMAERAQLESRRALQAAQAERAAAEAARREARRAEEVKRFVLSLFERADTESGAGAKTTALELLRQARTRIEDELRDQPALAFELKSSLARSLGALGDYGGALQLVEGLVGTGAPAVAVPRRLELEARVMHAEWLPRVGRNAESLERLRALERSTREGEVPRALRVAILRSLSVALLTSGSGGAEAVTWAEAAVRLADGAADVPEIVQLRAWMALANARQLGRLPGVLEPAQRALALARRVYPGGTAEPLLEARQFVALGLTAEGRHAEAIPEYEALVRARIELLGSRHPGLAGLYNSLGNAQLQADQPRAALASYEALRDVVDASDSGPTVNRAVGRFRVATGLAALRRWPEAIAALRSAIEMSDQVGPGSARGQRWRLNLATLQAQAGDLVAAEATLARLERAAFTDAHDRADLALRTAGVRGLQGRHDEALRLIDEADGHAAGLGAGMTASVRRLRAIAWFRAGRAGAHREAIEAADRALSPTGGLGSADQADLRLASARARFETGDTAGALSALREVETYWTQADPAGLDAARAQGHLALALLAQGDAAARAQAARGVASARERLRGSDRADDRRLLAELAGAGPSP